jgi:hypothetical protein
MLKWPKIEFGRGVGVKMNEWMMLHCGDSSLCQFQKVSQTENSSRNKHLTTQLMLAADIEFAPIQHSIIKRTRWAFSKSSYEEVGLGFDSPIIIGSPAWLDLKPWVWWERVMDAQHWTAWNKEIWLVGCAFTNINYNSQTLQLFSFFPATIIREV